MGGDLIALAKPDRIIGRFTLQGDGLPAALVQSDGLAVGEIARVHLPNAVGQLLQRGEPVDHGAGLGGQRGGYLGGLGCALRGGATR